MNDTTGDPPYATPKISPIPTVPDPCLHCPPSLPPWGLAVILLFFFALVISVGLNVLLFFQKRRLRAKLAEKVNMDIHDAFSRAQGRDSEPNANGSQQGPLLRKKTIALKKSRVEIPRENIGITVSLRSIGDGKFGNVWKGEARGLTVNDGHVIPVAARELPASLSNQDVIDNFTPIWKLKTHDNVVQCYGCCLETEPSYVIVDYVSNGTLLTYLRTNGGMSKTYANLQTMNTPEQQITLMEQVLFAFDVASGMEFLSRNEIIHGNLCAHNVLMTKEKRCKVADVGLATQPTLKKLMTNGLSLRWMAPEILRHETLSIEGDIWSYGVLLWQILTYGKQPYNELATADIAKNVMSGYRLPKPKDGDQEITEVMSRCWLETPKGRPSFQTIKDEFGGKLEEEADYFALGNDAESYYACVSVIDH
ncbi:tyrosine kinase receptor Cad96Ca-like [Diadema antillarum]|uniref:tyrosine kinase receptor Cad96Ca-like n=1 Tax=Diadema antillarum TaxID=105358 RepID=UPI003A854274